MLFIKVCYRDSKAIAVFTPLILCFVFRPVAFVTLLSFEATFSLQPLRNAGSCGLCWLLCTFRSVVQTSSSLTVKNNEISSGTEKATLGVESENVCSTLGTELFTCL